MFRTFRRAPREALVDGWRDVLDLLADRKMAHSVHEKMLSLVDRGSSEMSTLTDRNVTYERDVPQQIRSTSGLEMADRCMLMNFYIYAIMAGTMCLFGFVANTISVMMVRRHRSSLLHCVRVDRLIADFDIALQVSDTYEITVLCIQIGPHDTADRSDNTKTVSFIWPEQNKTL
jgi:hypothetical protein